VLSAGKIAQNLIRIDERNLKIDPPPPTLLSNFKTTCLVAKKKKVFLNTFYHFTESVSFVAEPILQ
jgi:hypothetical protein